VIMELDKTKVKEGDVIIATIRVNNIKNLAGYQIGIKYDPKVLEAFNIETGDPIDERNMACSRGNNTEE